MDITIETISKLINPYTDKPLKFIDYDGRPIADFSHEKFGIQDELLIEIYEDAVLTREIDNMGWILVRQGKAGFYISIKGHEISHVASLKALSEKDFVMPYYRTVPSLHVRGATCEEIFSQIMGKNTDPLKGRQMPGHLGKKDINVFVLGSPVGVGHVVALGVSMGIKYRKEERVIISYGGEGATSEGHFHSALNFAGLFKLPLIVFVLNNLYAISVPRTMQTASPTIAIKGKAYNVEGYFVDGNDAIATYLVTKKCVYEAKKSKKPFLIEALTYRLDPHSSADDDKRYRARKEVEDWERKDGIVRLRKYLEYKGLWDNDKENALREKVTKKIEKAVEFAENAPLPDPKDMFYEVYKETPWYLVEEYKELKEEGI